MTPLYIKHIFEGTCILQCIMNNDGLLYKVTSMYKTHCKAKKKIHVSANS